MEYQEEYSKILESLRAAAPEYIKSVTGRFTMFCPYIQFVRVDFLDQKDWPHNISNNSIYIDYRIDFQERTVQCFTWGHIYLTAHDQKVSYLAMNSMKDYQEACAAATGKKMPWMRKLKFSSSDDLKKKILKYLEYANETLNWCTDGYPYHYATVDIYPDKKN